MIFATLQAVTPLCVTLQADAIASIMQAACGKAAAIVQAPMAPASGNVSLMSAWLIDCLLCLQFSRQLHHLMPHINLIV